ncbi:hypothetical protein B0H13DRAFT_2275267 [Mycena leptocephala]|nr:hypothetical protein B0H13DRAFT_2275267 [Mycena leptocephala]
MRCTTIFTVEHAEYMGEVERKTAKNRIGALLYGEGKSDGWRRIKRWYSSRPSTTAQRCPRLIVPRREHSAMQAAHVWSPRNSCQPKGPSQCQRKEVAGPTRVGALPKWYPTKAGWLDGIRLRADHLSPGQIGSSRESRVSHGPGHAFTDEWREMVSRGKESRRGDLAGMMEVEDKRSRKMPLRSSDFILMFKRTAPEFDLNILRSMGAPGKSSTQMSEGSTRRLIKLQELRTDNTYFEGASDGIH